MAISDGILHSIDTDWSPRDPLLQNRRLLGSERVDRHFQQLSGIDRDCAFRIPCLWNDPTP